MGHWQTGTPISHAPMSSGPAWAITAEWFGLQEIPASAAAAAAAEKGPSRIPGWELEQALKLVRPQAGLGGRSSLSVIRVAKRPRSSRASGVLGPQIRLLLSAACGKCIQGWSSGRQEQTRPFWK